MVEPTRDNIHAMLARQPGNHTIDRSNTQAGSIFYRQQVESANAEQYAYVKYLNDIFRRLCFGQNGKRLRTFLHCKRKIMYKYMGSRCPLKKTPLKHPGEVLIVGFRALRLKAWDFFFPSGRN